MFKKILIGLALVILVPVVAAYFWIGAPTTQAEAGYNSWVKSLEVAKNYVDQVIEDDPLIVDKGDSTIRAEGYRYAMRIATNMLLVTDDTDPAHPTIRRCPTTNCKLGFDSPDFAYVNIEPISADYTYRVYGKRNTASIMLMQVMDATFAGAGISSRDLIVDEDGNWEVYLSTTKPDHAKNWLSLEGNVFSFNIRHIFNNWEEIEPSVNIEVINAPGSTAPLFSTSTFMKGMGMASTLPIFMMSRFTGKLQDLPVNKFSPPCVNMSCDENAAGHPDTLQSTARYNIPEGQAMIIEVPDAEAEFRNIQLGNVWAESLDYINRQTSLNSHQDHLDDDGIYRYVLTEKDPGYANWLDTNDHNYGGIMMRWTFTNPDNPPATAPTVKLVDLDDLDQHMPDSHPRLSEAERAERLKQRRLNALRRVNPA